MGYFTGKTIIITGAGFEALKEGSAGSIGFGIATAFAKEGANLAITGRNVKKLEAAKERLESEFGIRVLPIQADVNAQADNQAVVQAAVDQVMAEFGRIDALVNNAQASASGVTIADHTTAQFDLALYSGLYAAFYYMQACYPHLKETKGSVVNFASGAGLFGNYGQCAYAAAKEGIRGLTRVAATEWGPDGINANVVAMIPVGVFCATGIITKKDLQDINWSVLWMVAGGFALGTGLQDTGLAQHLIENIPFSSWSPVLMIVGSGLICWSLSNFISNTATAALLVPILAIVGRSMSTQLSAIGGEGTLLMGIAVSASLAMMLPISTPPNALAHATGMERQRDMEKVGVLIGIVGLALGYAMLVVLGKNGFF